ncbi:MAG TPA: aminodeoxychorismate/anthranilate synthase component II, partial [Ruminococcus sp.]|nr:aminodeoxychorismate/anthranilate synthase component II [Ruminococcus sp.]
VKVKGCEVYGLQFHPESILTKHGYTMIKNFLDIKL